MRHRSVPVSLAARLPRRLAAIFHADPAVEEGALGEDQTRGAKVRHDPGAGADLHAADGADLTLDRSGHHELADIFLNVISE